MGEFVLEIVFHALNLFCLEEGGDVEEDFLFLFDVELNFVLVVVL